MANEEIQEAAFHDPKESIVPDGQSESSPLRTLAASSFPFGRVASGEIEV